MKLLPPTKAYRPRDKKWKWHLLKGEITTVCNYVLIEDHRVEKDLIDLQPDDLCRRCWKFGVTE